MKKFILTFMLTIGLMLGIAVNKPVEAQISQQVVWCYELNYHFLNTEWALEMAGMEASQANVAWYRSVLWNYMVVSNCNQILY